MARKINFTTIFYFFEMGLYIKIMGIELGPNDLDGGNVETGLPQLFF